jgi:hypothetical protein
MGHEASQIQVSAPAGQFGGGEAQLIEVIAEPNLGGGVCAGMLSINLSDDSRLLDFEKGRQQLISIDVFGIDKSLQIFNAEVRWRGLRHRFLQNNALLFGFVLVIVEQRFGFAKLVSVYRAQLALCGITHPA